VEQFYTNWEHEAKEAWRKIVIYKDEASRYKKECEGKEKEIAELKAKINELTMDNMTHEYNQAEAEKFAPEYKRQIEEPLSQRISELEAENERLQSLLNK